MQRPVSDFDRCDHYVLRRSCGSPASIYILHLDADRCNPPRYRDDPADIQVSLFHPSQGRTLFLRPRAAALPSPQIGRVIVRSVFDRTLFVLGRAAAVAAPAGLIIWCMANLYVGDASILTHCSQFLDPFAKLLGMDGVILLAFILGFPANEIVVPIIIMSYLCTGSMMEFDSLAQLHTLLTDHGWTWVTALCVMIFSLMHFPAALPALPLKGNRKLEMDRSRLFLPTACGMALCFFISSIARICGLA